MSIVLIIVFVILGAAAVTGTIQLIAAKRASWKAVVLDVLTTLTTGVLVLLSFVLDSGLLLDIALIYAILSFAAVMVVARYLEGGI